MKISGRKFADPSLATISH